ncbi:hypothetical protein KQX54_008489 [Cotesia glomerata]|uniref:Uncharacterized protein n=1 Tax=Cotesia glomerata TaxID=32391 RepID=A0AAV7HQB4_COTGL|nr:hypothetical protein KQX54_008489 [Cotesia glomerata]
MFEFKYESCLVGRLAVNGFGYECGIPQSSRKQGARVEGNFGLAQRFQPIEKSWRNQFKIGRTKRLLMLKQSNVMYNENFKLISAKTL